MSGIFAAVSDGSKDCINSTTYGVDYHTHLGTQLAGLAFRLSRSGFWREMHGISNGAQLRDQFRRDLDELQRSVHDNKEQVLAGIGVISDQDSQPLIIRTRFGQFILVGAGNVDNLDELANEILETGSLSQVNHDGSVNAIEVVGKIIAKGDSITDGILKMWSKISGSMSILIMTEEGTIIAARDRFGVTPLTIGLKSAEDGNGYAVALESFALNKNGYEPSHYLQPGEIVEISLDGVKIIHEGSEDKCRVCSFFYVYTSFPGAVIEGIEVEMARQGCGRCLAENDDTDAKAVFGVPDSGLGHAMGYCQASGLSPCRPIVKYTPSWPRSFTPGNQDVRNLIADKKIVFLKQVIQEFKQFVLIDDSIVRGTQLHGLLKKMRDLGALKFHVRPACPPLMFPCIYLRSTRQSEALAARKAMRRIEGQSPAEIADYLNSDSKRFAKMVDIIRENTGADTLKYPTLDQMIRGIGLPTSKLCTYCWTGKKVDE